MKMRKYIKADSGQWIEIDGQKGHVTSVRKRLHQHGNWREWRYGWIHSHACMLCGCKSEFQGKQRCPSRKKVKKSTEDLMAAE